MTRLSDRYKRIIERVKLELSRCGRSPDEISLVVVSKMRPIEDILELYEAGCREFGENRVQEALVKQGKAPEDLHWHLIGTLQLNKVRKVIGRFSLIHAVEDLELAQKISSCSGEAGVVSRILLQVNTSGEETKHGWSVETWRPQIETLLDLPHLAVEGLMTMAPFTDDHQLIRRCFAKLRDFRDELGLVHLSMGMSHDYPIAIQEGATIVRLGTALWSES